MKIAEYRKLVKKERKPRQELEYLEQCKVVNYLDELILRGKGIVKYTAVNPQPNTPNVVQRMKAKRAGLNPGFPDIFIIAKKAFCLEIKIKSNKPTSEQKAWIIALQNAGINCHLVYSFEEAKEIIDKVVL